MKITGIIEARMSSSRLPGKVLLPVLDKPILHYLVQRLRSVNSIDSIVLATTINETDDQLVEFAKEEKIQVYRGSEEDVMARVIGAAENTGTDIVVDITGDCPILDPDIVEQAIQTYLHHDVDYVCNAHIRSYPDGMDVQVYSLDTLINSASLTNDLLDHEHVTLHIRNHPELFSHIHLIAPPTLYWPELGLTLDEKSDYELLKKIIEAFDDIKEEMFSCLDVIKLLRKNPEWLKINQHVIRKGDT